MTLRRWLRRAAWVLGIACFALGAYFGVLVAMTPSVDHLVDTAPVQTSYMRLRAEQREDAGEDRVDWVELDDVSPYLVCAVVKAEDRGFFRHAGFEWPQVRKALRGYLTASHAGGGSTITQQLARNLYLTPARSLHRKLREALIARRLESSLDKRRILELYLNVVEWGDGVWGAKQAARVYFGRSPAELGVFEAAVLASLLPAPRARLADKNLRRASVEQRRVLHQLVVSKVIDTVQFIAARRHADQLYTRLAHGTPLAQALAHTSTVPTPLLDLEQVLDGECGLAEELAATERARRITPVLRRKP
jgi:monofunctional biosynthetic peptidoglycan transglycosylase